MIIKEKVNEELVRFYSSNGFKIQKVGTDEIYDDAIELVSLGVDYVETSTPIDEEAVNALKESYITAGKILLGENTEEAPDEAPDAEADTK